MLQVIANFTLTQVTPYNGNQRNNVYAFNFANEIEVFTSWKNLTDTAVIKFPKNIYIYNATTGKSISLQGQNITGSNDPKTPPFILRGDQVTITVGYIADSTGVPVATEIFNGYVAEINNRTPIELKCEDNMFVLKQIAAIGLQDGLYNDPDTVKSMLEDLLDEYEFTVNDNNMNMLLSNFAIQNESVAQVLNRLRKDYKLEFYFRDDELRASMTAYYYGNAVNHTLDFQYNVISDSLEYRRAADTNIAVTALSYYIEKGSGTNINQTNVTTIKTASGTAQSQAGEEIGETQTIYFPNQSDEKTLTGFAQSRLNRVNVDGWTGKVTTFGLPYIKHSDSVTLKDAVLPERVGTYMVKSVRTTMTISGGLRQEVELDMRIDNLSQNDIKAGL